MTDSSSQVSILSFGDFLSYLRQQGFDVGVEEYVRVQRLFEMIGDDVAPENLKTLLCPLFAANENQQELFYRDFDNYITYLQTSTRKTGGGTGGAEGETDPTRIKKPSRLSRSALITLGVFVLALSATLVVVRSCAPPAKINTNGVSVNANAKTSSTPSLTTTTTPAQTPQQANTNSNDGSQSAGEATAKITPATPTPLQSPTVSPSPPPQAKWNSLERVPYYLVALVLPLLCFLLYELYRASCSKKILERQHSKQPPYTWSLSPKTKTPALYDSPDFYKAVRLMRRRQVDEFNRLDIRATISATIRAAGFPSFRYKFASKAPEYLVLINRVSMHDHQARFFNELVHAFRRESVFAIHYFYEDPRICSDETEQERVHLVELQSRYPFHRLLIFGSGAEMIDQFTGELADWTTVFLGWRERALLTPEPPTKWGLREIALSKQFVVLPGTIYGLTELVEQLETTVPMSLGSWVNDGGATHLNEITDINSLDLPDLLARLRSDLGEDVFQWLCACAVYPELDWDLTLYLGSLPCMGRNLVSEETLWRLIRLPWFRQGLIPDELRWHLMNALDPAREQSVRLELIKLLENDTPKGRLEQTYAADDRELNLLSQRWLYKRDYNRLHELLNKFKELPPSQVFRDQTLFRYLEQTPKSILDFVLPRGLGKHFYQSGLSIFGLKPSVRFVLALLVTTPAAAWIISRIPVESRQRDLIARNSSNTNSTSIQTDQNTNSQSNVNTNTNVNVNGNSNVSVNRNINRGNRNRNSNNSNRRPSRNGNTGGPDRSVALRPDPQGPGSVEPINPNSVSGTSTSASSNNGGDQNPSGTVTNRQCPPIQIIGCPTGVVEESIDEIQPGIRLTGRVVTGSPPEEPYEYLWEVLPRSAITLGADTPSDIIGLQTKGFAGQQIRVTLRVRGLEVAGCANSASCTVNVRGPTNISVFNLVDIIKRDRVISPDKKTYIDVSKGQVVLRDSKGKIIRAFSKTRSEIIKVGFSPDGRAMAIISYDDEVLIFDAVTGGRMLTLKHPVPVDSIRLRGDIIETTDVNGGVYRWTSSGRLIGSSRPSAQTP